MKFFATSTYLLMLLALLGNGCAVNDRNDRSASDHGAAASAGACAQHAGRVFRNPNHRARRIYSAGHTDDDNCVAEQRQ